MKSLLSLLLIALLFSFAPARSSMADESSLTMGIFPRRNAKATYELFTPLKEYLSSELGRSISLDVSNDFSEFWRKLATGKFDLIHCNQYHYLAAHRDFNFEVIGINGEFGKTTIAGSIIVRKDAGFNSLADLKGKKIVFGGDTSAMMSYIVTTYILRQAGLVDGDYVEEFAINPPNAVLAAYYRQADGVGAADITLQLDGIKKRVDITQLKYLGASQQLPHLPWAISRSLSPELRSQIRSILTTMNQSKSGLHVLQAASLDKIIPARDQDFDPFREIILSIKGERY